MRSCTIVLAEKIVKNPAFHFTNPELRSFRQPRPSTIWRCTGDIEGDITFSLPTSAFNVRSVTSFLSPAHHAARSKEGWIADSEGCTGGRALSAELLNQDLNWFASSRQKLP